MLIMGPKNTVIFVVAFELHFVPTQVHISRPSPVTTYGISFCRTGTCIRAYPKTLSRSLSYDFVNVIPCLVFWLARSPVSSANFLTHSHTHCIISHHHHSIGLFLFQVAEWMTWDCVYALHASIWLCRGVGWLAGCLAPLYCGGEEEEEEEKSSLSSSF